MKSFTLPSGNPEKSQAQHTPTGTTPTPGTPRQKPAAGWFLDPIQQPLNARFLSLGVSSVLSLLFLPNRYGIKAEIHTTGQQRTASHPAICRFIHIPFHFPSICHQILHTPILQCCRVRSRKYGLDSGGDKKTSTQVIRVSPDGDISTNPRDLNTKQQANLLTD